MMDELQFGYHVINGDFAMTSKMQSAADTIIEEVLAGSDPTDVSTWGFSDDELQTIADYINNFFA